MPLKKCTNNGSSGWRWGDSGKCYTGPNGKKQAIKQGIAVEGPDKFAAKAKEFEEPITTDELAEVLAELNYGPVDIAFAIHNFQHIDGK